MTKECKSYCSKKKCKSRFKNVQIFRVSFMQKNKQTDKQTDKQTNRQTDTPRQKQGQTDGQTHRQTDRQTDTQTHTQTHRGLTSINNIDNVLPLVAGGLKPLCLGELYFCAIKLDQDFPDLFGCFFLGLLCLQQISHL